MVATFLQISGTNVGEYRRGGATNRRTSFRAFFIWRLEDGRVAENWGVADRFDALQQLGIIPSDDELGKMGRTESAADAG
jgi:predicted ester cyclase